MNATLSAQLDAALVASFAFAEAVTVGGVAAQAVVTGISLDGQFVEGGTGEAGAKSITLLKTAFATAPAKAAVCVVRGQTLKITSVADRLRHWRCDLGDPSARI
jgi:hypothetical protein